MRCSPIKGVNMTEKVNQNEFYDAVRRVVNIEEDLLVKVVRSLPSIIATGLREGKDVKVPGLCVFSNKNLKSCTLKIKGKDIKVPQRKSVKVRPLGKILSLVK